MDGLSAAASVIAVVEISAKVASLCFQYSVAVKDAKRDIERVQKKVTDIGNVLEKLQQLLSEHDKLQLSTTRKVTDSLQGCNQQLQVLKAELEPSRGRKTMQRVGIRALKWPFTSKQVDKLVASFEQYEHTFSLALQVDQTGLILSLDRKLHLVDKKTDALLLPTAEGASFDSHADEHNSTCLHDTRTKLLHHIQGWAKDKNGKPVFWLNGAAGTGKSTIARTVAQTFAGQQQLGASFFFKKGEGERGNAKRFLTTIATQLAICVPEIRPGIMKAIDADPAVATKALTIQFEQLILRPLSGVGSLPAIVLIIVIDALDECEQDSDIRAILQLLSQLKDLKPISLRILVTSRPELHIRLGFKRMSDGTYEDLILHEVAKETIEHDIRIYLEHELTTTREERSLPLDWPGEESIQTLVKMAVPLFIFAATVCRFVGEISGNPRRRLEDILSYETEGVSQLGMTYLPILEPLFATQSRMEKGKLAREFQEIVGSIVVLESPLPITSLARLLGKAKEDISCRLDSLHSVLRISDREDVPIRLLHLSFREFLVDTSNKESPFWVDERSRHEMLASHCIELMSSPGGLRQNICSLLPGTLKSEVDEGRITSHISPELQYACRYWVYHLEQSEQHVSDKDTVDTFLRKHFLHWLEAMSLVGDTSKCVYLLETLCTLADVSNSALSLFLQDARRFTLRFQYILQDAPLQIYSSALIFAPGASIIRNAFIDEMPGWIKGYSKRTDDWDACRSVLEGHTDDISAVAFSPDGRLVASTSSDKTVRIWEAATGECRSICHTDTYASTITFLPDSQRVMLAHNKTVQLWDVGTGSFCSVLEGYTGDIAAIAFSTDGRLVVLASYDKIVRIWETATGSCCSVLEGYTGDICAVAFSMDNQRVMLVSEDMTIQVWEVATGSCRSVLEGHTPVVNPVAFSLDGQLVASVPSDETATVRVWEVATGSCRSTLIGHIDWVSAVTFSPDGQLVASASSDETVRVWEVATGSCRSILKGHTDWVMAIAFSPDGQLIASASDDKTVRVWETVRMWEAAPGSSCSVPEDHTGLVQAVAFSPDGQLVASASQDMTVRVWEAVKEPVLCRSVLKGHTYRIEAVAFSPDGQLVASASYDKTVRIWEAATTTSGTCCSILKGHTDWVNAIAFSPDGQLIASASEDKTVRVWEAASRSGSCLSILEGHAKRVWAVAFSPNGQLIASGSFDNTIRVWEAATRSASCRSVLIGHTRAISGVAFSPDSQLIASGSGDQTVRIWEVATGSCQSVFKTKTSLATTVTFSPDGQYLQTDRAVIPLPSPNPPSPSFHRTQRGHIVAEDEWISLDQQRLLWLPSEYRPTCSKVHKDVVCLGHSSGRITVLKFRTT